MSAGPAPKRQRKAGSFSPASPPYHKAGDQTKPGSVFAPQTPTSPPYMSSSAQPNGSYSSLHTSQDTASTPPSSVMSHQSTQASAATLPTPAHSITGGPSFGAADGDGDTRMSDDTAAVPLNEVDTDVAMADHRQTGHERQSDGLPASEEMAREGETAAKGPLFKLCENPLPVSRPHLAQDLIGLYNLSDFAEGFRRYHPGTGEKLKQNVLRKSYEGKLKPMGLAGKNKPIKRDDDITYLAKFPAEEWHSAHVHGHDMEAGLAGSLTSKLDRALQMNAGKYRAPKDVPKDDKDKFKTLIGTDDAFKARADSAARKAPVGVLPGHAVTHSVASTPTARPTRPERAGTKRRYDDTSFKGYGEGYPDDDGTESGGGEDGARRGSAKKRRKELSAGSPLAGNHFNPGMVSVRR